MRTGFENRRKLAITSVVLGVALFMFIRMLWTWNPPPKAASPAAIPNGAAQADARSSRPANIRRPAPAIVEQTLDPTVRLDLLKTSEANQYKGSGRNIFRAQAEPVELPKPLQPPFKPPEPVMTGPPAPPPINLKFFGFATREGEAKKVFLAEGDNVFIAGEGEIVNRRYRVVRIGVNSVEVEDVFDNRRQTIPLTSG